MVKSAGRPRPGSPMRWAVARSKASAQVGEPCRPIFSSIPVQVTPFGRPPSSRSGTRNSERPRVPVPGGAVRARSMWPMRLPMSWAPKEIQHFEPVMRQVSPSGSARVRMRPTSEPASGSEMQIEAVQSPVGEARRPGGGEVGGEGGEEVGGRAAGAGGHHERGGGALEERRDGGVQGERQALAAEALGQVDGEPAVGAHAGVGLGVACGGADAAGVEPAALAVGADAQGDERVLGEAGGLGRISAMVSRSRPAAAARSAQPGVAFEQGEGAGGHGLGRGLRRRKARARLGTGACPPGRRRLVRAMAAGTGPVKGKPLARSLTRPLTGPAPPSSSWREATAIRRTGSPGRRALRARPAPASGRCASLHKIVRR